MTSGADVLGKFYEVFLRYGNGAKEIGIVLTPRHVTRFAVDAIGVSPTDVVFDPACGTGGFLVAAFDHVRTKSNATQLDRFKRHSLFGIEQESYVAALAIVNMIFRGDGKNNIIEANCFSKFLRRTVVEGVPTGQYSTKEPDKSDEAVTRVFMNPPFALNKGHEWKFVESAMKSMQDNGVLFVIVPMSVVTEGGVTGAWRTPLLNTHTLMAVISFPEELFYPVHNQTVAVILKKGVPHPKGQKVFWGRIVNDGFRKSKGRRLPTKAGAANDLETIRPKLSAFLRDGPEGTANVPEFMCAAELDFSDPILEFAPEAYLNSRVPSADELMSRLSTQIRDNIAALVDMDLRSKTPTSILDAAKGSTATPTPFTIKKMPKFRSFRIDDLFDLRPGDYHSLSDEDPGDIPVASCGDGGNGISGMHALPDHHIYRDALTIAFNASPLTTKIHPYPFGAKDDVAVAIPRQPMTPETLIFIQAQLNAERWRFSYYRKCFRAKLGRTTVELPAKNGGLDVDFMKDCVQAQKYWWFLSPRYANMSPAWPPPAPAEDDDADK